MGRSMICGAVPLFVSFAVLATLINAALEIKWKDGVPYVYNRGGHPGVTPRPLYKKDGFLAGEETPVWFANVHYDEQNRPQYTYSRLNVDEPTPMVKESLDYWNGIKKSGGFPIRRLRSVNVGEALPSADEFRSADSGEVVYPSILLVMAYDDVPILVDNLLETRWSAEQLVVYALSFWGTVDSSLRKLQNPRVSLRIAGIVITTSKQATPYVNDDYYNRETFSHSLSPMMDHWRSVAKRNNTDFPIGSYDIVVHMTDKCPLIFAPECILLDRLHDSSLSATTKGPPCNLKDQIGGVIIYDDLAFNGLQRATLQMSKVLGGSDEVPSYRTNPRIQWSREMLNGLSKALKCTTCMSAPKEFHRPGTPVPAILAGEFMPSEKQCQAAGYAPDAWTCWDTQHEAGLSNCETLKCSNQHVWGITCSEVGPTLDGSFCNAENTKICLDGRCVFKK